MNFLIINTTTSIGTYFLNYFKNNDKHQISEFKYDISFKSKKILDLTIKEKNIDTVIFLNETYDIDLCQNKTHEFINANKKKLKSISQICAKNNLPIIYISSSEIYGDINTYDKLETDNCKPLNNLGTLSLECEEIIRELTKKHFILRCSWLFGDSNCYIKQIINNAHTPLFFCNDKIVNPTPINKLLSSIEVISATKNYGVFNYGTKKPCSKLQFTEFVFNFINMKKEISPFPKEISDRLVSSSKYSALNTSLFEETFNLKLPSWKDVTCEYIISLFE